MLRSALAEFQAEKLRDDEIAARSLLARVLLERKKIGEARHQIEEAGSLAAKTFMAEVQLQFAVAAVQGKAASGNFAEAGRMLAGAMDTARRHGYLLLEYEIRLQQAELEFKAGRPTAGKIGMQTLRKDAQEKGFGLVAAKAGAE